LRGWCSLGRAGSNPVVGTLGIRIYIKKETIQNFE